MAVQTPLSDATKARKVSMATQHSHQLKQNLQATKTVSHTHSETHTHPVAQRLYQVKRV